MAEHPGIAGKVAVVTGAARGIGAATARVLAESGARAAAIDNDDVALEAAVQAAVAGGHEVRAYPADVTDRAAVDETVARIEDELGPIAILANVAGVLRLGRVVDLTDEAWVHVFAVNTLGVLHMSRAVASRMMGRRAGTIVTVSSNAAFVPRIGMAAYGASKAATTSMTKTLGLELAEYGIRCNLVSPGSTDTPMLRGMWMDGQDDRTVLDGSASTYRVGVPLRKLASSDDVAAAIAFLASDRAGHITMHDLCVDGGAALGA